MSFDLVEYWNGVNGSKRNPLSEQDRRILDEMAGSNYFEYLMKGECQSCCYSAMKVFRVTMYCLLQKDIPFHIYKIEMIVDIDDSLLKNYLVQTKRLLYKWLNRRNRKRSYTWECFNDGLLRTFPLFEPKVKVSLFYR